MISIKSPEDIKLMSEGGRILAEILHKLKKFASPGITTKQMDELAHELVLSYNVKPAFKGYENFPNTLCISINDEIVHGIPSHRQILQGDLLSLDMGVIHKEYYSDSAITFPVLGDLNYSVWKKENPEKNKLIETTKESMYAGIKNAVIGKTTGDIGNAVQNVVEKNGFGVVRVLVGHGIGKQLHEEPQVPNYGKLGEGIKLKEGMVIAIEPMVTAGDWNVDLQKDGFTYKTRDGSLSAHFEHTVAITKNGPLILTEI